MIFRLAVIVAPPVQRPAVVLVVRTTSVSPRDQQRTTELPVAASLTKPLTQPQGGQVGAHYFA